MFLHVRIFCTRFDETSFDGLKLTSPIFQWETAEGINRVVDYGLDEKVAIK